MSVVYEKDVFTVTEERDAVEIVCCDTCKKLIYKRDLREELTFRPVNNIQVRYWSLTTGHHDWGNDSADSMEFFHFCSPNCVKPKLDDYLEKSDDGLNSMYFELKRKRTAVFEIGETAKRVR